ncbi:MAG TPA: dTDP-4-dehydrorhamnose 3,5-epimerase [Gemmatimonadales bacterium]|nr:dTDP-4-dehydrorhamnose 3,5-epimerase [Gemmatimonadales bacterium]
MKFTPTAIPDVIVVEPAVHEDDRGFLMETWHAGKFRQAGLDLAFVQDNHSRSVRNTIRGLHYQIGRPQGKLLRAVAGEIFDVAVDLRRSSPTYRRWVGVTLSAANRLQVWIPEGFAHGFYVTGDGAEVVYKCTGIYSAEDERTLRWDDPAIGISWPLGSEPPLVSAKDAAGLSFQALPTFA